MKTQAPGQKTLVNHHGLRPPRSPTVSSFSRRATSASARCSLAKWRRCSCLRAWGKWHDFIKRMYSINMYKHQRSTRCIFLWTIYELCRSRLLHGHLQVSMESSLFRAKWVWVKIAGKMDVHPPRKSGFIWFYSYWSLLIHIDPYWSDFSFNSLVERKIYRRTSENRFLPSKYGGSPPGHRALPPPVAFWIPPPAPCLAARRAPCRAPCGDVSAAASGTLGFTGLLGDGWLVGWCCLCINPKCQMIGGPFVVEIVCVLYWVWKANLII